jgi:hypothetical protein
VAGSGERFCYQYRMLRSRSLALLVATAALAFPAASLAQSAGDDQYQDPLAGQQGGGNGGNSGDSGGNSGDTGSAPTTPSTPSAPTTGGSEGTAPQATAAASPSGELPRTGFDVLVTVELGLALLLTGLVSQRTLVLRERRDSR